MNKLNSWQIGFIVLVIILGGIIYFFVHRQAVVPTIKYTSPTPAPSKVVADPVDRASERVTKKPFGIYITPKTSPVQPEKFTGFHTGVDFETFPQETNSSIPFYAICPGKILTKRTATGYGGVLVQSCTINNQAVTVIYGHVSLKSIVKNIGDSLSQGEKIGFLGQPPTETDGERKHLHLGIHKGTEINIKGYVQSASELSSWLDWQKL